MKVGEGVGVVHILFIYLFNFLVAFALSSYFIFRLLIGHFDDDDI